MRRTHRLARIRDLARHREDELLRNLGRLQAALAEEERRLRELRDYQREYGTRFADLGGRGMPAATAADYVRFLGRLDTALREQEARVEAARAAQREAYSQWRASQRRRESLDKLTQRAHRLERRRADRRSQAETDEHAAFLGRARPGRDP